MADTECATGCKVWAVNSWLNYAELTEGYGIKTLKAADSGTMMNYDSCTAALT